LAAGLVAVAVFFAVPDLDVAMLLPFNMKFIDLQNETCKLKHPSRF
jgi:hypothetical protein